MQAPYPSGMSANQTRPVPPLAQKRPVTIRHHGVAVTDDYAWLRADNWQQVMRDPAQLPAEIRAQLEAENAWVDAQMADTAALQDRLFAEMRGRIKEDDSSVPAPDGPFAYATRFTEGAEQPLLVRMPREGGTETVLLDGNVEAEGKDYFRLAGSEPSPDHRLLLWGADDKGSEFATLKVRDLATGMDAEEAIVETTGGGVWSADGDRFFYVWLDDSHRPCKLFRHRLGTPQSRDALVWEEANPGYFLGIGATQSRAFLVIDSHDHESSELHLLPLAEPDAPPRLVAPRMAGQEYSVEHNGDTLYILTNADGAEDFKIVTAPVASPGRENWRDLIPHRPGRLILGHVAFKRHLVRLERVEGLPQIVVRRLADGEEHAIAFAEEAYALGFGQMLEFDTDTLRFTYSSMTTPARVYDYDMETRQRMLRKEQQVPSGHDPDRYVTRRVMAPAADGETVPVSLLYARDTPLDGSAPCLLYGYGAYGHAIPAGFSTNALSLVDRGFVYAIAHIRGGKDKGYRWYTEGRREKKPNTFSDFIAAAEHLIAAGFTGRGRIVAHGGSAGGMLMGAVANMAPELFAGIIADVPFVDVLNTMLDATLPLTPPEWPEWGNPLADEAAFHAIASWSPYDNVKAKAYPAILATAGLTDPRVTYWEPAKWVAKLRATRSDDNPLLLRTHMTKGHAGAAGRFDRLREVALSYAFALKVTGRAG